MELSKPHDCAIDLRDEDAIANDHEPLQASYHRARFGWIAELAQKLGNCSRICGLCVPDRQIHVTKVPLAVPTPGRAGSARASV